MYLPYIVKGWGGSSPMPEALLRSETFPSQEFKKGYGITLFPCPLRLGLYIDMNPDLAPKGILEELLGSLDGKLNLPQTQRNYAAWQPEASGEYQITSETQRRSPLIEASQP